MTIFSSFLANFPPHSHTILAISCVHASNWFTHLQQNDKLMVKMTILFLLCIHWNQCGLQVMQRSKYMKHKSRDILDFCCELVLPSLPGSHAWVEKKEASSYTLFQHAQFPMISENFCKICSITLTSTRHANFSCVKKCLPLTTLCVDDDEEAMKSSSSSLTGIIQASVHSS